MMTTISWASVFILLAISYSSNEQKSVTLENPLLMKNNVCVIELFTSEGCSSCPSADALMPKLREKYGKDLIVLSFHVDYWDRLGWKDAFSMPQWTQRQRQYAMAFKTDNIYTPQAVVNGKTHITGSNALVLQQLIAKELDEQFPNSIILTAKAEGHSVSISYNAPLKQNEIINIALVQHYATTNVTRGENSGHRLQHYNVVRQLKKSDESKGSLSFSLPNGISSADVGVVAFVQHKVDMHISSAAETDID